MICLVEIGTVVLEKISSFLQLSSLGKEQGHLNSIHSSALNAHDHNNKEEADNTYKQIFNGQTSVQVS